MTLPPPPRDRLALADRIQDLDYPSYTGAWLKAVRVPPAPDRLRTLRHVLRDDFVYWTPEHAPWGTFNAGPWQPADRATTLRRLDLILDTAATRIAQALARAAAGRFAGEMTDLDALRRWFTTDLWPSAEPSWFINTGPGPGYEPAAIGIDDELIAIIWLP